MLSKTQVDKAGATARHTKKFPKKIDANRRVYKDAFESLQAEVRQPLTEWELRKSVQKAPRASRVDQANTDLGDDSCSVRLRGAASIYASQTYY